MRNWSETRKTQARTLLRQWYASQGQAAGRIKFLTSVALRDRAGSYHKIPLEAQKPGQVILRMANVSTPEGTYLNCHDILLGSSPKDDRIVRVSLFKRSVPMKSLISFEGRFSPV